MIPTKTTLLGEAAPVWDLLGIVQPGETQELSQVVQDSPGSEQA